MLQISPFPFTCYMPPLGANTLMLYIILWLRITAGINEFLRASLCTHRDAVTHCGKIHRIAPSIEAAPAVFAVPRVVIVTVLRGVSLHCTARHHLAIVQILREKRVGFHEHTIFHFHRPVLLSVARVGKLAVGHLLIKLVRHVKIAASGRSRGTRRGNFNQLAILADIFFPSKRKFKYLAFFFRRTGQILQFTRATVRPCRRSRAARRYRRTALGVRGRA